jgi:hypothetical protein
MRLGVAYNVFDGDEMLIHSIRNLRPMVDIIVLVVQQTSNFGNTNPRLDKVVNDLITSDLVNYCYWYTPEIKYDENGKIDVDNGLNNELNKRNIGLNICRANGCDAFMTIDCDELYDTEQFLWAKKDFDDGGYDTSFSQMRTFYKEPTLELCPPETYYAPLFYRIKKDTQFSFSFVNPYPVEIDPTRRIKAGYSRIYTREEIEMYHYAYVRHNLRSKVDNSSSQMSDENKDAVCNHFDNFKSVNEGALFIGMTRHPLREVENKFNIEL